MHTAVDRPMVLAGEIILCVAHGTSLRGIVKHLENLTPEEICGRDLPNGIPIVYRSDKHFMHVILSTLNLIKA